MAGQETQSGRQSKTRRRRGRQPNNRVLADLTAVIRSRIKRLAALPWLSAVAIFNLLALDDRGISPRTFRRDISKIRTRLGISTGRHGPRTLKRRADLYATSLLEHLATNHPDAFVSAVLKRLIVLHFGDGEGESGPPNRTPKKQRIEPCQ